MTEIGLSPEYFWGLTWYDLNLYLLKLHKDQQRRMVEIEDKKFFTGYIMATIGNYAGKVSKKHLDPMDFWKDDTQADEVDIQALMNDPKIINRFKKDGR